MPAPAPSPPTSTTAPSADDVFALFEVVLAGSKVRHMKEAKAIVFELPAGDAWTFDPRREGPLFARGRTAPAGSLVLRCTPALLARLVTEPAFELREDDDASFTGHLDDLLVLAAAVAEQGSTLGIRLQKGKRS